ncbi:hypothetical protein CF050_15755 [Clostridium botulinum]|uniref:DUF3644 domain-containing protein n=1 Tax=Clostridium botulinum TaxID=1491 RepID=UPI00196A00C3|nr:DUF3644 domain-containing protein [Clostridium botulinum]MBN3348291.1 hypothetical protein [Clostridium botulinum]
MESLTERLLNKSKEAFMMAIEIYNKPTIKYRVEGFSFFICNAWELMLKAHIINKFGEEKIYYKDNPSRTITLEKCIAKIFTNSKAPLRLNLEKIIELRNTSTHFITEEYEMIYIPLFQSCVFNFIEKILEFHDVDMTEIIPQNFLTLAVSMKSINTSEVRAKYSEAIADRIINTDESISKIVDKNNNGFAIRIEHHHFITKDKNKATSLVHIDKKADSGVQIIKELKDPNNTHKYTAKKCCEEINKRLERLKLSIGEDTNFNKYHFNLFCKYYEIKKNTKFCYVYKVGSTPKYSYSLQTIEFIVDEIRKNGIGIIQDLKEKIKK